MTRRRLVLRDAERRLREAGVASPEHDAAELLAHVHGVSRTALIGVDDVSDERRAQYEQLVARRAAREPLQHLTGVAYFRHVSLAVGPGVFVPRPETEVLAGWAIDHLRGLDTPAARRLAVVDLGTGSGAIALAIKDEVPEADVYAVEADEAAYAWARRNLDGTGVDLRLGDLASAFDDLRGTADVVVSNPPYIPLDAWESVAAEVRDHDPQLALFSGDDGLDAIRVVAARAAVLLKHGGVVGVEHADVQGEAVPAVFASAVHWAEIRDHDDLVGRPRFTTARLAVSPP